MKYGNLPLTLAPATKADYTFDGWYTTAQFTEGTKITVIEKLIANLTLYAKFTLTPVE